MKLSFRRSSQPQVVKEKEESIVFPDDITGHIIPELMPLTQEILATGREVRWSARLADEDLNPKVERGYSRDTVNVDDDKLVTPSNGSPFNLVSSKVAGKKDAHKPVIDLDFPIMVIPSSTPGHFHLYVDKELTWGQYKQLLYGFLRAGLIEEGWYNCSVGHEQSFVRPPHLKKPDYYDRLLQGLQNVKEA